MWKLSKLTLFIIICTMSVSAGISIIFINWDVFESGKGVLKELMQPVLFILLGLYFLFPYVKRLKEESSSE